jgi:hypothetical protein
MAAAAAAGGGRGGGSAWRSRPCRWPDSPRRSTPPPSSFSPSATLPSATLEESVREARLHWMDGCFEVDWPRRKGRTGTDSFSWDPRWWSSKSGGQSHQKGSIRPDPSGLKSNPSFLFMWKPIRPYPEAQKRIMGHDDRRYIDFFIVENYVTTDHQIRTLPSRQQIRREKSWKIRIPSQKHDRENTRDTM